MVCVSKHNIVSMKFSFSKVKEGSENSHEAEFVSKRYFAAFFGRRPPRRVSQCICLADPGLSNCSEA